MLESNNRKTKTHHNSARSGESMWILCEPGLVLLGTPSSHLRATGATVSSTVFTSGSCTNLSSNAYQMCVKYTEGYIDSVKYLTYIAIVAMYSQCISIYFIIFHNHILMHQDWYRQKRLRDVTIWMWPCYEIPPCSNGFMSFVQKCWTCQAWLQQQSVETIHQPTVLEQYSPNKLTQNLAVTLLKRRIIFPISSFGFHVRFPECKSLRYWSS